jgi:hypothetical protein
MDRDSWLARFSEASGSPAPTAAEIRELLRLASVAAHASERTAAPLTCWMAARSGLPLGELLEAASKLAEEASPQG